ncbi:transmembrane protein, putative (macronuclear) [Tetrahymena thermophila SB210]|uniref:Transmembrane protein, putative n=1 Tax=Tetrahymena thermophila (strain SB210) TaxID=312017 RepID=W7XGN5_TETTS|nr:transmembrane protein, putative [Tetrahymena thermophila SB210]EWS73326.1 transmembrane protein, putative [Tetrahymena thermophila SB210]|eukprot:XP_012654131.1 transmembrane protein, putative [Tetrahymena thermophila SB210]
MHKCYLLLQKHNATNSQKQSLKLKYFIEKQIPLFIALLVYLFDCLRLLIFQKQFKFYSTNCIKKKQKEKDMAYINQRKEIRFKKTKKVNILQYLINKMKECEDALLISSNTEDSRKQKWQIQLKRKGYHNQIVLCMDTQQLLITQTELVSIITVLISYNQLFQRQIYKFVFNYIQLINKCMHELYIIINQYLCLTRLMILWSQFYFMQDFLFYFLHLIKRIQQIFNQTLYADIFLSNQMIFCLIKKQKVIKKLQMFFV